MHAHPRHMRPIAALITGLLLLGGSTLLLGTASGPTDPFAVIGATGVVLSAALLSLTALVLRWRSEGRAYVSTSVMQDPTGLYEELAATVDAGQDDAISAAG
jgi:hypothetical protein